MATARLCGTSGPPRQRNQASSSAAASRSVYVVFILDIHGLHTVVYGPSGCSLPFVAVLDRLEGQLTGPFSSLISQRLTDRHALNADPLSCIHAHKSSGRASPRPARISLPSITPKLHSSWTTGASTTLLIWSGITELLSKVLQAPC